MLSVELERYYGKLAGTGSADYLLQYGPYK